MKGLSSKTLAGRTIFIKVAPHPITFTERRAVLIALQKYGRIETFKKLPTSASAFIAIATRQDVAADLIAKSPIIYQLVRPQNDSPITYAPSTFDTPAGELVPKPEPLPSSPHLAPPRPEDGVERTEFVLHMFPTDYNHKIAINVSPLNGPWPQNPDKKTLMANTLRDSVPPSAAQPGLIDWERFDQNTFNILTPSTMYSIRQRDRLRESKTPPILKGLMRFWEAHHGKSSRQS